MTAFIGKNLLLPRDRRIRTSWKRKRGSFVVGGSGLATVTIAESPPTVSTAVPAGGAPQRSMVAGMTVTFGVPVVLEAGAFVVARRDGTPTGLTVTWSVPVGGDGSIWSVSFANADGSPLAGGSIADGVYDLTIVAAKVRAHSADGPTMAADHVVAFHRLFGDADGDGDVDGTDSRGFRTALGAEPGSASYNPVFDFDGDGDVDGTDSRAFRTRLGTGLN